MKQVVQRISGGPVRVVEVPRPVPGPTEILVQTAVTLISPGTERAVTKLAGTGLIGKARARPDLVRKIAARVRDAGLINAARDVRSRLTDDLALGYSGSGVVVQVGELVDGIVPGQRVATAGAGKATHSEFQVVPRMLCAPLPENVTHEQGSFATVASIALHAFRLAEAGPGSNIVVIGLGLIGQLVMRIAEASGCRAVGIDIKDHPLDMARANDGLVFPERGTATTEAVLEWTRGRGADAVVLAAADKSGDSLRRAPELCRDRAKVVVVGDVAIDLPRTPLYDKELDLVWARSYGPGRYDETYEGWNVDYPIGYVRWSEGRNLEAVLDLISSGKLNVDNLVTHRFPIEEAAAAYHALADPRSDTLAIQLTYRTETAAETPIRLHPRRTAQSPGIGVVGAGRFVAGTLLPALESAGLDNFQAITSAGGLSARNLGDRFGFTRATSGSASLIASPDVELVVIATPHDLHAQLTQEALDAGKHVFCEKPLALTEEELEGIEAISRRVEGVLFVGFNRRWSPAVERIRSHFQDRTGPVSISYEVNAETVNATHWYNDRVQGGRLLGEVCHFIDTCSVLVGAAPLDVHALSSGDSETILHERLVVTLRYPDGSLATINYSTGARRKLGKERVLIRSRQSWGLIDDFRNIVLDGKRQKQHRQDKGHVAQMKALAAVLAGELTPPTDEFFATTRATLAAASALGRGRTS